MGDPLERSDAWSKILPECLRSMRLSFTCGQYRTHGMTFSLPDGSTAFAEGVGGPFVPAGARRRHATPMTCPSAMPGTGTFWPLGRRPQETPSARSQVGWVRRRIACTREVRRWCFGSVRSPVPSACHSDAGASAESVGQVCALLTRKLVEAAGIERAARCDPA